jgi:hypothetical protein
MKNNHEYVEKMLEKAMTKIDGKTMYDGVIIGEMNKNGVFFHFTKEGIHWRNKPY